MRVGTALYHVDASQDVAPDRSLTWLHHPGAAEVAISGREIAASIQHAISL